MKNDDIYNDLIDVSKANSAARAFSEIEKQKRIEDFELQQQEKSPIYKQLIEQNTLLNNQMKELKAQNKLLLKQIDQAQEAVNEAKRHNKHSTIVSYISLAIALLIGIVSILINILK